MLNATPLIEVWRGEFLESQHRGHAEATIAGNLAEMFMQMTAANDIDLRDSVASPSLRLDSMMVAGS